MLALALAFVAGFAIQRGGICVVIAVREAIERKSWSRFLSFLECAAWAMIGLLLANALGWMELDAWPRQPSLLLAALGGAAFGVGALLNGACAFGSAGRFAAGEMSFLALIPGFVAGATLVIMSGGSIEMKAQPIVPASGLVIALLGTVLVVFMILRLWTGWRAAPTFTHVSAQLSAPHWPASLAMAVIAFSNVGLMLLVFAWPYTTLLVDVALARGMDLLLRTIIVLTFLTGALVGSASAGRFKLRGAAWREIAARFGGGALMGVGAALIPGGNDALILLGLPLLQPSAFVAYGAMVIVIAAGFIAQRYLEPARAPGA